LAAEPIERPLPIPCRGAELLGVVSLPAQAQAAPQTAVVIVVGGPQYRAGSHRQFVHLARALARAGHAALRFDCRGMGDSEGPVPHFEDIGEDIGCAIDALRAALPSVQRVVLWGLCDGASAALLYAQRSGLDDALAGIALANPWVRTEVTQARTQIKHYYARRLRERDFWLRLASGKVSVASLQDWRHSLLGAARLRPGAAGEPVYVERMAQAWRQFPGPLLLLLSGYDLVAQEFLEVTSLQPPWRAALDRPGLTRVDLPAADHTFSDTAQRQRVEALTCAWLGQLA
jgi:uncharacterized protein